MVLETHRTYMYLILDLYYMLKEKNFFKLVYSNTSGNECFC